MLIFITLLAIAASLWAVVLYNLLVRDRHRVAAAWSDVDVQLKRRHDLIPKLVDAVKQHASYERGVLESLVQLRSEALVAGSPQARQRPESALASGLQRLIAVAENYPDLKASRSFLDLQRSLSQAEDLIQHARRYYNGTVNNLNTRLDTFPDLLIARGFGFRPAEYFQLAAASERGAAEVS